MRDICLELIISASMEIEFVIAKKKWESTYDYGCVRLYGP